MHFIHSERNGSTLAETTQNAIEMQPAKSLQNGTLTEKKDGRNLDDVERDYSESRDETAREYDFNLYMNVGQESHFIEMTKLKEFVQSLQADDTILKAEFEVRVCILL